MIRVILPTNLWRLANTSREDFEASVERSIEYINAGDAFQIVPSIRFEVVFDGDAFAVYRALRLLNPSPFMFYVKSPRVVLVGASPEIMCRVEDGARRSAARRLAGLPEVTYCIVTDGDAGGFDPTVPRWVDEIVSRATAKNPADRFASMADLVAAVPSGTTRTAEHSITIEPGTIERIVVTPSNPDTIFIGKTTRQTALSKQYIMAIVTQNKGTRALFQSRTDG